MFRKISFLLCLLSSYLMADPMMPIGYGEKKTEVKVKRNIDLKTLEVDALIVSSTRKFAKISGHTFKIGDTIGRYVVKNITISRLVLEHLDTMERHEIALGQVWDAQ